MPKTERANAGDSKSQHTKASRKTAGPADAAHHHSAGGPGDWAGKIQDDFSESTFEHHTSLLSDSRLSQPANVRLKAQLVQRLQSSYGNSYVQRLVDRVTAKRDGARSQDQADQANGHADDFYLQIAQRIVARSHESLQTKLTVGAAGDKYERQADDVARQVVGKSRFGSKRDDTAAQFAQREPSGEIDDELQLKPLEVRREGLTPDEEEELLQPKRLDIRRQGAPGDDENLQLKPANIQREDLTPDEEEELLQPKRLDIQRQIGLEGGPVDSDVEQSIEAKRGQGRALPDSFRQSMESSFGTDFSGVQVHSDSNSDALNQDLSSRAFTVGSDIFVRKQDYNPSTRSGQELLAHELTHVVQQSGRTARRDTVTVQREEESKTGVREAGAYVVEKGEKGIGWVAANIEKLGNKTKKWLQEKMSAGWKTLRNKFPWIATFLEGLLGLVVNPIQLGWSGLKLVAKIAWFIIKSTAKSLIGNIGKVIDIAWKLMSGEKWDNFSLFENTRAWFKDWDENKLNPMLWGEFLGVWTGNARDTFGWFALISGLFGLIPGAQVLLTVSTVTGAITLGLSALAVSVSGATLFSNIIHWWAAIKQGKPVEAIEKRLKRLSVLSVGDLGSLAGALLGLTTEVLPSETAKQATGAFIGGFTEGAGDMASEAVEERAKKGKEWTEIWAKVREKGESVWEEMFKNIHRIGRLIASIGKIFMAGFKVVSMVFGGIATVVGGIVDLFASAGRKVKTGEWDMKWDRANSVVEGIKSWNQWEKEKFFPGFWNLSNFGDDLMKWVTKEKGNVFKQGGKTLSEFRDIQDRKREG